MYSHRQSCANLTSWALSSKRTFKTGHFQQTSLLNGHDYHTRTCSRGLGTFARRSCPHLLIHPSHRTATTAPIQARGTLFGTAGKGSRSKAPPYSTSASFSVRHASMTSRTNRADTWFTDQVRGATSSANRCVFADANMDVYLFFGGFLLQ